MVLTIELAAAIMTHIRGAIKNLNADVTYLARSELVDGVLWLKDRKSWQAHKWIDAGGTRTRMRKQLNPADERNEAIHVAKEQVLA